LLIDTGEPDVAAYLQNLAQTLEAQSSRLEAIVATHWHMDHVGGIAQIRRHFSGQVPNHIKETGKTI
jgi:glyoxylase-like metal-dependent hydrolase (beta-lactamase superfamily II)